MSESRGRVCRVSIPFYVPDTEDDYSGTNHYPRMFAEDVAKGLFPTGGNVNQAAVFQLSPNDEHSLDAIKSAFARYGGGYRRTLSSILSRFGNHAGRSLVSYGSQTFEVAPSVDADAQTIGFAVVRVSGARSFAGVT